jgi:hypothetical protein
MSENLNVFPLSNDNTDSSVGFYSLEEEKRDWRKQIESHIDDAKEEIVENDNANEKKVEETIGTSEKNVISNSDANTSKIKGWIDSLGNTVSSLFNSKPSWYQN